MTLSVLRGGLRVVTASPGAFQSALELTGTLAAVTQALRHIEYLPPSNYAGNDTLTLLAQCPPLSTAYRFDAQVTLVPTSVSLSPLTPAPVTVFEDVAIPVVLDVSSYSGAQLNVTVQVQHGLVLASNVSVSSTRQFSVNASAAAVRTLNLTYVPVTTSPQYTSDRLQVTVVRSNPEYVSAYVSVPVTFLPRPVVMGPSTLSLEQNTNVSFGLQFTTAGMNSPKKCHQVRSDCAQVTATPLFR